MNSKDIHQIHSSPLRVSVDSDGCAVICDKEDSEAVAIDLENWPAVRDFIDDELAQPRIPEWLKVGEFVLYTGTGVRIFVRVDDVIAEVDAQALITFSDGSSEWFNIDDLEPVSRG